jgi:hypothetical protein
MSRALLFALILAPAVGLSACTLRQPAYNPELGGFPILNSKKVVYRSTTPERSQEARLDPTSKSDSAERLKTLSL